MGYHEFIRKTALLFITILFITIFTRFTSIKSSTFNSYQANYKTSTIYNGGTQARATIMSTNGAVPHCMHLKI